MQSTTVADSCRQTSVSVSHDIGSELIWFFQKTQTNLFASGQWCAVCTTLKAFFSWHRIPALCSNPSIYLKWNPRVLLNPSTMLLTCTGFGLGQTGHPESTMDYHRRLCILCRWSSRVEQFLIIDTECTFIACI